MYLSYKHTINQHIQSKNLTVDSLYLELARDKGTCLR